MKMRQRFSSGKGIYLLPNLLTTAGLFAGFYAVVASMHGKFEHAAVAVFIAMIMDGLDGRIARITNTQTDFGAEYDSMADLISFGVAPALVAYNWALSDLGKFGWLATFVYVVAAALRLARFNTQVGIADKRYFQGLASPSAAAVMVGLVWVGTEYNWDIKPYGIYIGILTITTGLLMVSNFRYSSFKDLDWKNKTPFMGIIIMVIIFILIASEPATVLFIGFSIYALSGPILTLWHLKDIKEERSRKKEQLESDVENVEEVSVESNND